MLALFFLLALHNDLRGTVPIGKDTSIYATEVTIGDWMAFTRGADYWRGLTTEEKKRTTYPITGITFEQAQAFCRWKENKINQNKPANRRVHVCLPDKDLYRRLIHNKDSLCRRQKCPPCAAFQFNYSHPPCPRNGNEVQRADAYWPDSAGIYNLQGNVAEMTATKGLAMGGSFRQPARDSWNDRSQPYDGAQDWVGFRFIIVSTPRFP